MRVAVVLLVLVALATAAPVRARSGPPAEVVAVGGPATMHRQAIDRITAATGSTPTVVGGADRYATAVALSQRARPDGADVVYVASGRDFPDALAAAPLLDGRSSLLLVDPGTVQDVVADELRRLAPDRVVVLGGPASITEDVADQLAAVSGHRPTRLSGIDRYATAAAISTESHPDGADVVYVASGRGWADALAAVSAVDAHDGALVLTEPDALPAVTAEELSRLRPAAVHVLGGPAAISDVVLDQVRRASGVRPTRLAGEDRYATAAAVAHHARPDGADVVYAVSAQDWVDALAAGTAIAAHDAVLLPVDTTVRWPAPDPAPAVQTAATRQGTTSFAVIGTDGSTTGHLADRQVAAASTVKVMFLLAYLRQPSVRDRDLTADDLALLEPMITRSENDPATRIADQLGPGPMAALAAEVGMQDFAYTRPWGNSRTSARDQAQLMASLEALLPDRHQTYAMDLLTRVVPDQRWGVGQLDLPGWRLHFKGGWGSATGSVTHQVVRLRRADGTSVSLAVMTTSSPSHAYGTDTLQIVFQELLRTLP